MPNTPKFDRLTLGHNPGEWDGTFGATAAFMVNEIITNDNTPITVTLSGFTEDTDEEYADQGHTIVKVEGQTLITDTGLRIDLEWVTSVTI